MMARRRRVGVAAVVVPIALLLAGFAPAARPKPRPTLPTPAYSPPPAEPSPFSKSDMFCDHDLNQFDDMPPADPRLRQPATVVWLTGATESGATGEVADIETFARLANTCGGIGGRPLDVHVVHATGDPAADCANATALHPVIVVSTAKSAAESCIVRDQQTILVSGSDASNADLTGSGGRLAAIRSSEGVQRARLLDLAASGRLDQRKVAIVTGDDPAGLQFQKDARAALATEHIEPVPLAAADTVLAPSIDLATLGQLVTATAATRHGRPLEAYGFEDAAAAALADLQAEDPEAARQLLKSANLYAFSPTYDPFYRSNESLNTFSQMCSKAVTDARAPASGTTTTTVAPEPPISGSVLTTADVCLLSRITDRALFSAGPTLDQRAIVNALHRLPYVDQAAPGGTPKPRPNQVVNEPVRRIEQVVVLTQLQGSCPSNTTTTTTLRPDGCWAPVSGWDDGGKVVNTPLASTPGGVSH
jgi:hypothetical protein